MTSTDRAILINELLGCGIGLAISSAGLYLYYLWQRARDRRP